MEELNQADIVFVCLPTPFTKQKGYDDGAIWEVVERIGREKFIIIKSTVLPGTTKALQKRYSHHTFFFNPEFLRVKTARNDFLHPQRQIIGYTKKANHWQGQYYRYSPKLPNEKLLSSDEAEMVKYIRKHIFSPSRHIRKPDIRSLRGFEN